MTKKKNTEFEARVNERYDKMFAKFTDLDAMTQDMLRTYCITCVQIDDLNDMVQEKGYFIVDSKDRMAENPAVNTLHKLNADKARYFAPLKRHLTKQVDEEAEDDMDEFLGI